MMEGSYISNITSRSSQKLPLTIWFGILMVYLHFPLCICQVTEIYKRVEFKAEFSGTKSGIFEFVNIAIEQKSNGHVYIGARNRLYQLDNRLINYFSPIVTGPVKDDIACHCKRDGVTDNLNKLLLIDADNNRIISCGSVEQGVCELRQMGNLKKILRNSTMSIESSAEHVAAKDYLSTVGYIATTQVGKTYLFVGSSKTTRDEPILKETDDSSFYTISKRFLPRDNLNGDMFSVFLDGETKYDVGIRVKDQDFADDNFRINFIDGFATHNTGYFILTHPSTKGDSFSKGDHTTYISQFCMEQPTYEIHSYLELPLECNVQGIRYTRAVASRTSIVGSVLEGNLGLHSSINREKPRDVVFISFVQPNGRTGSALCMFTLAEIERRFLQLMNRCMKNAKGSKPTPISWIKTTDTNQCGYGQFKLEGIVCDNNHQMWEIVQHLQDDILTKNAVFMTNDTAITAIEIMRDNENKHTVGVFGTENGQMLKVRLDANTMGSPSNVHYETEVISPPLDVPVSGPGSYSLSTVKTIRLSYKDNTEPRRLYAMTPRIVVGLPLYNCSKYTDCKSCLSSKDPFCGWCTLENKCTSSGDCESSVAEASHWFIRSGGSCPRLESDDPLILTASDSQKTLVLKAFNIPFVRNGYVCSFGDLYYQTATNIRELNNVQGSPIQVHCASPPPNMIPNFLPGKGLLNVPLSLLYQSSASAKQKIVSTNFSFYKCSVYTSCMSCVSTNSICAWCLVDNTCTHQSNSYCPQINAKTPDSCPQLSSLPGEENKVYLNEETRTNIPLRVSMLPAEWDAFQCEIDMKDGSRPLTVNAKRGPRANTIQCLSVKGSLPANVRSSVASLRVTTDRAGQKVEIDNPHNVKIEVYRCGLDAGGNCGACLQSPVAWHCGWCETTNKCSLRSGCSSWLEASIYRSCKNPEIKQFYPSSAPFGSDSSIITLEGTNFDPNLRMKISVAGVSCRVLNSTCCKAKCVAKSKSPVSDPITLCISNSDNSCKPGEEYTTTTTKPFYFVDPRITSFEPKAGLRGWGTNIVVKGNHLDTGTSAIVNVDEKPCIVERRTSAVLKCRLQCTAPDRKRRDVASSVLSTLSRGKRFTTEKYLKVAFDGAQRIANGFFEFVDDVSITTIKPDVTLRSGGLPIRVEGDNLNLIQNAQMTVTLPDGEKFKNSCYMENLDTLVCESPDISEAAYFQTPDQPAEVLVDIESADCSLRSVRYADKLSYNSNPVLDNFEDKAKVFKGDPIYISGKNLCPNRFSCDLTTVRVMIGDDMECNVTRLNFDQVACVAASADIGSYPVVVLIGGYSQHVGSLEYQEQVEFPLFVIGIIVGFAVIVILAISGCVWNYRRRVKAKEEELKNVQMQMNVMESKVAKVCKEAFAELQTDINELDMLAAGVGIPYWDYRNYLMRVLFPDPVTAQRQHTLLLSHTMERNDSRNSHRDLLAPRSRIGMDRFNLLLENKIFLLSFIKAAERQRSFTMKDKGQVAGLLFIILQNRLPYATEILEDLLADLIRRNFDSRSHPKLLFRRTESVAEKMLTHWFSILLYGFMVECAGEPLFTLFRAIKQQVDKGPLDAFTNEARYSLSEDKLLRQTVEHETITVRVTNYLGDHDQPEYAVKVLSCDSISQVKRKVLDVVYMNHPYSIRPHPEDIDLECRFPKRPPFLLRDEDSSSKTDGEWKKVNTLAHYEMKTNTEITLIPSKDQSVLNYSVASAGSKASSHLLKRNGSGNRLFQQGNGGSLPRQKQAASSRSGTPTLPQDGMKVWHLAKQVDQDQSETIDRGSKMVSEIYLARLLTAKGTIQKYVDDLFETIFSVSQRGHVLPSAIKHMFDFLDHQAEIHGITDPEIVYTWKSNCLPLRFWVNLIKNPEFVYDVHKSPIVDCYLSVIAQAFMDSCSTAEYKLGKDSPSNKLLYAREIPEYRKWVKRYYYDISNMPRLNPRDLSEFLQNESFIHSQDFNAQAALLQLYGFVQKYSDDILAVLEENPEARRQQLVKQVCDLSMSLNGSV